MAETTYFNVNASIGRSACEETDFATAAELLAHMDYLGIARSLVWHLDARNLNPTWGNRRLLEEIETSAAKQRLVPAFVITPSCFYENGTVDFLCEMCSRKQVKALRVMPQSSRFSLRQLERILSRLAEYQPLLLWDCNIPGPEQEFRDLEYLANLFPGMHFTITQKMWPGFGAVLDLMWRCRNVLVDISWLHMRNAIEMLVEEFGAARVLFGIGYKSHYGAAIASLAHAHIPEAERELIAHGNAERLLDLQPLSTATTSAPGILEDKPFWKRCRSGMPVTDVHIIDAHTHTAPFARGWFMRETDLKQDIENLIQQMDETGVDKMIICPEPALFSNPLDGNRQAAEVFAPYAQRFAGYAIFNPRFKEDLVAALDEFFATAFFVGFKILPSYWNMPVSDPGYLPLWKYANKHNLPILIHTWNDSFNSPAMLHEIVARHPGAVFILGHAGGGSPGRIEAEELTVQYANVYLEFCGSFTTPMPMEETAARIGWNRLIFGSDTGAHSQAWELGRFLSMPVADSTLLPALSGTIEKVLQKRR